MYVCVCVCVCYFSLSCHYGWGSCEHSSHTSILVLLLLLLLLCVCACVSSQSERSCSSRFNQRVYHYVFLSLFLLSSCLTALCSAAKFFFLSSFSFFFLLLDLFVCVCVSRNEDRHNVFDVYLSFFFSFGSLYFFFSHYILTYLKYTLNSLYKQKTN